MSVSTEPTTNILRLQEVDKTYYTGDFEVPVLHDVDLDVVRGELMVIVGPSGSGKSTLLNLIGGIDRPTTGEIWFDGRDITTFSDAALTAFRRESVGFVFQFYNLVPTLTARENVLVSTEISRTPMQAEEALRLVELEQRMEHFPAQLSGGEQQRVAVARAVAKNPQLLLCDEPTGSLDLVTGRHVLGVLAELNRELGKTIVVITHNSAIAGIAHRVVRLGSGTVAETHVNERRVPAEEIVW